MKQPARRVGALVIAAMLVLSASAVLVIGQEDDVNATTTEIDSCTTITESGHYELTSDVSAENDSDDVCIDIQASDVHLDGNGHTVSATVDENATDEDDGLLGNETEQNETDGGLFDGLFQEENETEQNESDGGLLDGNETDEADNETDLDDENATDEQPSFRVAIGINAGGTDDVSNVTVSNVTATGHVGVYAVGASESTVENTTASGTHAGVVLVDSHDNLFENNTVAVRGAAAAGGAPADGVAADDADDATAVDRFHSAGIYADNSSNNQFNDTTAHGLAGWAYVGVNNSSNAAEDVQFDSASATFNGTDVAVGSSGAVSDGPSDEGEQNTTDELLDDDEADNESDDGLFNGLVQEENQTEENQTDNESDDGLFDGETEDNETDAEPTPDADVAENATDRSDGVRHGSGVTVAPTSDQATVNLEVDWTTNVTETPDGIDVGPETDTPGVGPADNETDTPGVGPEDNGTDADGDEPFVDIGIGNVVETAL